MANAKISELPAAGALAGTELVEIVQSGVNKQTTTQAIGNLGGGGGGGSGTVTSFSAGDLSPLFTTSEADPTTTPALSFTAVNQNANLVYAGPTNGAAAAPTFRALVDADIDNAIVIGKVITGFTSGAGTVAATDTVLQAIQKLDGNISGKWALTGTSTLTGATVIASSTNTLTFTSGAPSGSFTAYQFTPTFTGTASTGETFVGMDINATFGGTITSDTALIMRLRVAGSSAIEISNTGQLIFGPNNGAAYLTPATSAGATSLTGRAIMLRGAGNWASTSTVSHFFQIRSMQTATGGPYEGFKFAGVSGEDTIVISSGTIRYTLVSFTPVWNITGGTNTLAWMDYNPTETALTGVTHYGILQRSTSALSGFGTATPTALIHAGAVTTSRASLRIEAGATTTAPSSPNSGDVWHEGTGNRLMFRQGAASNEIICASAVTTEAVVSDTTVTIKLNNVTYKLLARA